jgi:AraC-like DNA-binding protein
VDLLSDILRSVRLSGGVFFHASFSAPFCVESPPCEHIAELLDLGAGQVVPFHIVVEGSCEARVGGENPVVLESDDVVIFFHGGTHVVASRGATEAVPIAPLLPPPPYDGQIQHIRHGGGGPLTIMICGFLQHETAVFSPLFSSLPRVVAVSGRSGDGKQHLFEILQIIEEEARAARPGGSCLLARLTELMFIEVLRAYLLEAPSEDGGWLRGTQDPFVSRSLQLLHSAPDRDWTLEKLCREVGRSRSALAEGFSRLVGLPPMQYLARWRMELAAQLLTTCDMTVSEVARHVGYHSDVAFNRAFRRISGLPPVAWSRREARRRSMAGRPQAADRRQGAAAVT